MAKRSPTPTEPAVFLLNFVHERPDLRTYFQRARKEIEQLLGTDCDGVVLLWPQGTCPAGAADLSRVVLDELAVHAMLFMLRVGGKRANRKDRQRLAVPTSEPVNFDSVSDSFLEYQSRFNWAALADSSLNIEVAVTAETTIGPMRATFSVPAGAAGLMDLGRAAKSVAEVVLEAAGSPQRAVQLAVAKVQAGFAEAFQVAGRWATRRLEDRLLLAVDAAAERGLPGLHSRQRARIVGAVMFASGAWRPSKNRGASKHRRGPGVGADDRAESARTRRVLARLLRLNTPKS